MKYGLALPNGHSCGEPNSVAELAVEAEQAGFDGVFIEDYVFFQGDASAPTCDPWIALAAIAERTERIRLGTQVTPLARRRPWNVARQAAALDQLSGGRMVLGVGLGDARDHVLADASFGRLGEVTDPVRRAEMLDESLEIIAGLWEGHPFRFDGAQYTVDEVTFTPTPHQQPRIPIWVGGGYPIPGPTRRAARWDGACLYGAETHDLSPAQVRTIREAATTAPYDICVGGRPRRPGDREWLMAIAEAGATWWTEYLPPDDLDTMRATVRRGPQRID